MFPCPSKKERGLGVFRCFCWNMVDEDGPGLCWKMGKGPGFFFSFCVGVIKSCMKQNFVSYGPHGLLVVIWELHRWQKFSKAATCHGHVANVQLSQSTQKDRVCVCVELLKRSKTCTSLTTAAYIFMTLYLEYW